MYYYRGKWKIITMLEENGCVHTNVKDMATSAFIHLEEKTLTISSSLISITECKEGKGRRNSLHLNS